MKAVFLLLVVFVGTLVEKKSILYSRKFDLSTIRQELLEEHMKAGLMRIFTDEEYENLTEDQIMKRYQRIGEEMPQENQLEILKKLERTRQFKLWHDHSDILNHTYVSFMISIIYDSTLYLTNEEYKEKFPTKSAIDVASIVERPKLYILGRSKSTDKDQLTYVQERLNDLYEFHNEIDYNGVHVTDMMRFFTGDGPARQFEAGQQRGGHFSCVCGIRAEEHRSLIQAYGKNIKSLDERRQLFLNGNLWLNLIDGQTNPFANLRKDDLASELETRGINTLHKNKTELQTMLQETLEGLQRPPALMCGDPRLSAKDISCQNYEILACEPLHDITNVVHNLLTELPTHIDNIDAQKKFEQFCASTMGEKIR